jgi:hypothetical protein
MQVSGTHYTLAALYPGKGPPEPIESEAGWTSELVWTERGFNHILRVNKINKIKYSCDVTMEIKESRRISSFQKFL